MKARARDARARGSAHVGGGAQELREYHRRFPAERLDPEAVVRELEPSVVFSGALPAARPLMLLRPTLMLLLVLLLLLALLLRDVCAHTHMGERKLFAAHTHPHALAW